MKTKFLIASLLVVGIFGISTTKVNALEDNKIYNFSNTSMKGSDLRKSLCPSEVGKVVFSKSLQAGGKDIELYCTYSDKDAVLEEINEKYYDTVQFIKENYGMKEDLNNNNWKDYRNAMINVSVDFPNVDKLVLYSIANIDGIFDIYENDEVNDQIKSLVTQYNKTARFDINKINSVKEELDSIIPNYSDNFGIINNMVQPMVGSSLNVAKASEYANRHATNRNSAYYSFSNGDCTNFMSQILEYSGVRQVVYDSEHSGWWHKTSTNWLGWVTHTHSRSWTMADTFSRYMGVTVKTTDISAWANGLREGDFIALDKTNDGSWDHMGYVTAKSTTSYAMVEDPIRGLCFDIPDVKVAQHTSDYNAWLSSSTNGWETYYTKAAFGRIRG